MNEVLAVIYYNFRKNDSYITTASGLDDSCAIIPQKYNESDLFFNFFNIMIELSDGFLNELDNETSGI